MIGTCGRIAYCFVCPLVGRNGCPQNTNCKKMLRDVLVRVVGGDGPLYEVVVVGAEMRMDSMWVNDFDITPIHPLELLAECAE